MDFGGRKEIFRTLVGSHNYGLSTPESDKDYKVFVSPNFNDLYFNKQFSKSYIGETEDLDVHDIRKVSSLWWKANVNFLEVLFSDEIRVNKQLYGWANVGISQIFDMKNDIARMNLPYLYDACIGMSINKMKLIDKGTEGTKHLMDMYGYDTKSALHSLRILDFLSRFQATNFEDFKLAIKYNLEDKQDGYGKHLLEIKHGVLTRDEYLNVFEQEIKDTENYFKSIYKSQKPNEETNQKLIEIVKEIVKSNI